MCTPFNEFIEALHKNGQLDDYALGLVRHLNTYSRILNIVEKFRAKLLCKYSLRKVVVNLLFMIWCFGFMT